MKETFYFSHDYTARQDNKIKKLISRYGIEGYGTYWCIIEDLYLNNNSLELDIECIAYDLKISESIIESIIKDFDLFIIKDKYFYSKSIKDRLNQRAEKSAKAKASANTRWSSRNANALQTQSDSNAIKESKGKENKVKENKINIISKDIIREETKVSNILNIDKNIIKEKYNISDIELNNEIESFINYWTEPNTKGKQRYEFEKTFEPNRRLATWLSNNKKWNKKNNKMETHTNIETVF